MPRGQNCTGCCGGCGRHFTSLSAFERHRVNFKCVVPEARGLVRATENGTCRILPNDLTDVVIWRMPGSYWNAGDEVA